MRINQNPTRSLDRILNQEFGSGTFLMSEGAAVILVPGATDQIQISQTGNRLQILVNGSDKFLLTEGESKKFSIRGDLKNITIDPAVTLYSNKMIPDQTHLPGILAERGEQLGHARRMESSFETAVTRGMMKEDLKEDGFINHTGKQLQRLLSEMGAAAPQQTAFRTEKDLLPFLNQIQSHAKSSADLKLTVQNIQKQINSGEPVDLEFLVSQINGGLKQAIKSTSLTQPGRIPFEQHEIPFGESQRGAFAKWAMMNDAISNNDIEKIAAFANDASILKFALPSEKASFLKILAGAHDLKHQTMIQILQSAMNAQEFKTIMEMAGAVKIQDILKGNPEFNITADVFQSGEFVSHFLQGFTPQQIFAARSGGLDLQNPLLLAIATPEQKAAMIQVLQSGYVSMGDNQSLINILQSAVNKSEFDQIVNAAGGKAIGSGLMDPASLLQWNRLAGAYDRMDLTTDFVEGVKYSGALLDAFPFDMNESISFTPLMAAPILRGQSIGDVLGILDTFMKDAGDWINVQMNVFDRGAFVQAGLENLNRMMAEMPLLNIPELRHELFKVLRNSNVTSEQISNFLQNLGTTSAMSSFDLRNLITQPLAFAHQNAASEAMTLLQNANAFFQENLQLNIFRFGTESSQVRLLKSQIERAQNVFQPFAERLQSISNLLSEASWQPADFVKSFSKFTSDLKNFSPVLANVFPSTAEVLNQLFEKSQTIERLVNKQIETAAFANPVSSNFAQLKIPTEAFEALRNGSLPRQFLAVNQELARIENVPRELTQLTKDATAFLTSIQDGSYAKTLNEVAGIFKKYDDPVAELTKTTAEQGAEFLTQLYNGAFSTAADGFFEAFNNFQNNPGTLKLNQFFERLTVLTGPGDVSEEAAKVVSDIATGELRGSFSNVIKAAAEFRQSPAFRKMISLLEGSGKFLNALSSGNFQQNMEMMNSRFGYTPAIAQVIERAQHLTSTGTHVINALVARDFERPVAQITRKTQAKTQAAKDLPDVETIFSQASTTFYALTEIDHMDVLWQYHRQLDMLNDKALSDSGILQFEKEAQFLARDPDLKKNLRSQFKTLASLL